MNCEEIEEKLNYIVEEIYRGLNDLADMTKANESREVLADRLELFAWDICKHWPTCFAAHDPYVPPGQSGQS